MSARRFAIAFAVLATTLPAVGQAACKVETLELPVRMIGSRAVATVGINGTSVPLMVDSGAFFSFLTEAAATQLDLPLKRAPGLRVQGITGRVETRMTTVEKLTLFKGDIDDVQFAVGGNEPGAGTMGLIGRNILSFADTEYDLAHGVIRFLVPSDDCAKSNMAYWAGDTPVTELELIAPYRAQTPAIRAEIKLNGTKLVALFDTGATTIVTRQAARRADVSEADMTPLGTVYGGGRGSAKSWSATFDRLELGGEVIRNDRLLVGDFEIGEGDLLLGIDFFLSHRIYVSKQQSKIFITYNGGPVFALARGDAMKAAAADASTHVALPPLATADEYARRGAASGARQDYASALADLDQACALAPTSADYLAQRGALRLASKQPAKALEDFDRALQLDPAQTDARMGRAGLRFAAKDRTGAKADLDAVDQVLAPQAPLRLTMARLYLVLEQPALAIAQLDRWIPSHPDEVTRSTAYHDRCVARLRLNTDLAQALDDCDVAVGLASKNASYLESRGWVYLRQGKDRRAIDDFDASLALRPKSASATYGRGVARTRAGETVEGDADTSAARKMQGDIEERLARQGLLAK